MKKILISLIFFYSLVFSNSLGLTTKDIATLKKELAEQKKSLEQVRTSLYGDEGKKEKDDLLKEKK